jgi:hypothetical protein
VTPALLALALLAQPEAQVSRRAARELVSASLAAEQAHGVPTGLLVAVALAETGGRARTRRERHGCSVGPWQLYLPGCPEAAVWALQAAGLAAQAHGAAWLLAARRRSQGCPWRGYNPGSRGWCRRVEEIHRRLLAYRGAPDA